MTEKTAQDIITLGGVTYQLKPPTFDTLRDLLPAIDRMRPGGFTEQIEAAKEVVRLALEKTPEEAKEIRATVAEILDAIPAISRVTGLEELGKRNAAAPAQPQTQAE